MAPPKKAADSDDLLAQLGDLGISPSAVSPGPRSAESGVLVDDPLADLENLANKVPIQRTGTPRRSVEGTSPSAAAAAAPSSSTTTAAPTSSSATTTAPQPDTHKRSDSSSWWGGFMATASAVARQAEAAVKELQESEEAKKWAEQVRGNVGVLKGIGES